MPDPETLPPDNESELERLETKAVKDRENIEHPRDLKPPPNVVVHGPHVVVDPHAPVATRILPADVVPASAAIERIAELEAENNALRVRVAELEYEVLTDDDEA